MCGIGYIECEGVVCRQQTSKLIKVAITLCEFTNLSASKEVIWDFGDGDTSMERVQYMTIRKNGRYTVRLKVDAECHNEIVKTIDVGFIPVQLNDTILSCMGEPVF